MMDPKDLKAALKSARDAIRLKDFKEALKHCKVILKADNSNYNAYVFIGVAAEGLNEAGKALTAYKKAIEIDDKQILAWQGLCGFYEKSENKDYYEDLCSVYHRLIELFDKDNNRKVDINSKLAALFEVLQRNNEAIKVYESILDFPEIGNETKNNTIINLIRLLHKIPKKSEDEIGKLSRFYDQYSEKEILLELESDWINYLNFIKSSCSALTLLNTTKKMLNNHSASVFARELLCKIAFDQKICNIEVDVNSKEIIAELISMKPDSIYVSISQILDAKQAIIAMNEASKIVEFDKSALTAWVLLAKSQCALHMNDIFISSLEKINVLLKSSKLQWLGDMNALKTQLKMLKIESLLDKGTHLDAQNALNLLLEVDDVNLAGEIMLLKFKAYLVLENVDEADKMLSDVECSGNKSISLPLIFQYHFLKTDYVKALEYTGNEEELTSMYYFWHARVLWKISDENKTQCLEMLLKSAKMDQFYPKTFLYLGHYYSSAADSLKALRCYQKAYDLDQYDDEIGIALVETLIMEGNEAQAMETLRSITQNDQRGTAKWAWLRLGLQQMRQDEVMNAISSLQSALRIDPSDADIWECLGEAYLKRGSYSTAMKAFSRACELSEDNAVCRCQIAYINTILAQYSDAITEYEEVLSKNPENLAALKGMAETRYLLAKDALYKFLEGRAIANCEKAIYYQTKAVNICPDMSCLWKMLGDSCTMLHSFPSQVVKIKVPMKLLAVNDSSETMKEIDKISLIILGGRCYGMALKLQQDNAALWHDLSLSYFYQLQMDPSDTSEISKKAMQAAHNAVSFDPANFRFWNSFGVIAACSKINNPAIAQHCFIKSLEVEQSNVLAWTNLGILYLNENDIRLAHEAFKCAQSVEPSYIGCWVGQAIIAESVGNSDAMDLFRHTTELSNHPEAMIGYANWVCDRLKKKDIIDNDILNYSIEKMAAVPASITALIRYTSRVVDDPVAFNMLALLLEHQELFPQAVVAAEKAVSLLTEKNNEDLIEVKANFARILCRAKEYELCLIQFDSIKDSLTLEDVSWMALALFFLGKYEDCSKMYLHIINLAEDVHMKSEINAALGITAFKANDISSAKDAFFKSFQCEEPSVHGLQALCALGLLENDRTLAGAVVPELSKLNSITTAPHLSYLKATLFAMQGDLKSAKSALVSALHLYPDNRDLWYNLSLFLYKYQKEKCVLASHCAHVAIMKDIKSVSQKLDIKQLLGLVSTAGALHSQIDADYNCLSFAKRAVHTNPECLENWFILLLSIYAELIHQGDHKLANNKKLQEMASRLAAHLMGKVEFDLQHKKDVDKERLAALHVWSVQQYVLLLILQGNKELSREFLEKATWHYENDQILKALLCSVSEKFKDIQSLASKNNSTFIWLLLFSSFAAQGLTGEVNKSTTKCINSTSSILFEENTPLQLVAYLEQAINAYNQLRSEKCRDPARWTEVLNTACNGGLEIEPNDPSLTFLQGCCFLKSNDIKSAKKSLIKALYHCSYDSHLASLIRQALFHLYLLNEDWDGIQNLKNTALSAKDGLFLALCDKNNL